METVHFPEITYVKITAAKQFLTFFLLKAALAYSIEEKKKKS